MNIHDLFPELVCIRNGDPFIRALSEWDNYIDDCLNDGALDPEAPPAVIAEMKAKIAMARFDQAAYGVATLSRWYAL